MPDLTLGLLHYSDPAKVLARAAEKLGVPAPPKTERECHMRSLSACQNEPHCSEAGECVLYLAIGSVRQAADEARVERVAPALALVEALESLEMMAASPLITAPGWAYLPEAAAEMADRHWRDHEESARAAIAAMNP